MAVNLRHALASQRRHFRVTAPIMISIDEAAYPAANWSISGFKIGGVERELNVGDVFMVYVKVPFQGFDVGFEARARVVRHDSEDELAAEFLNLDTRSQEALDTFVQGLTRGEMTAIDGVIRRLDLPVTPVTLNPENNALLTPEQIELKRRKGIHIYSVAGGLLAIILLIIFYSNVIQMRVSSAFAMGRNDVIVAPSAGDITYIAPINKPIAAGQPILTMEDHILEDNIAAARYKARQAQINLTRYEGLLELEKTRLASAKGIVSGELKAASDTVTSLEKNLAVKQALVKRIETPVKQGYIAGVVLDKAESDMLDTERLLNMARQERAKREQEYSAMEAGFQVSAESVQTGTQDVQAQRDAAQQQVVNTETEVKALEERKKRMTITAPADGKLVRVFIPSSGSAKYGDPVAVFERSGKHIVQAFLTQDQATNVTLGKKAVAYFPSHWWSVPLKVSDIDYYSLTLNQSRGLFQWQNYQDQQYKTVVVTLEPADEKAASAMASIPSGTAATTIFNRFF